MLEPTEQLRLAHLYEQLRLKLLDLSKKNRMLNYSFSTRSKRHLQIVDEVLEEIYRKLGAEESTKSPPMRKTMISSRPSSTLRCRTLITS